jgi:hypothetical protein
MGGFGLKTSSKRNTRHVLVAVARPFNLPAPKLSFNTSSLMQIV